MPRTDHGRNIMLGLALTAASVLPAVISPGPPQTSGPQPSATPGVVGAPPTLAAGGPVNGKLQIHFIDVGQGDGAILISPQGQTVLFDNGKRGLCNRPVSYLQQLGVTKIDYMVVSHYHDDHIGCTKEVLTGFPLQTASYDRGGTYNSATFNNYTAKVGAKRLEATPGTVITLDSGAAVPVRIEIVAVNGNGIATTNENDLSVVAKVDFGNFEAVIGGDLSGFETDHYEDIETSVAPKVGQVEVYKVNHHGSRYSSNETWLSTIKPKIGIVSTGVGNNYGHPTLECLDRLHAAGIKTYWTEIGEGAEPDPDFDVIAQHIVVQNAPGEATFTVTYGTGQVDSYTVWEGGAATQPKFAWSKNSNIYHVATCPVVPSISPANLQRADTPPTGKNPHGCVN